MVMYILKLPCVYARTQIQILNTLSTQYLVLFDIIIYSMQNDLLSLDWVSLRRQKVFFSACFFFFQGVGFFVTLTVHLIVKYIHLHCPQCLSVKRK